MGMASSDNEDEIYYRHAVREHVAKRPRSPDTWERRGSDEDRAYYQAEVTAWAEGFPEDHYWDNDRR